MDKIVFRPSNTYQEALDRAAGLWGIEPEYGDTWGKLHVTPAEVKQGILRALGVATAAKEDLDRAVAERLRREWDRLAPPVAVVSRKSPRFGVPVSVPEQLAARTLVLEIRWENGGADRLEFPLGELETTARAELADQTFLRKLAVLPEDAPLGYHDLEVSIAGQETPRAAARLIVCPDRAYDPPAIENGRRAAGLAIALYGVRSDRNWGCGDFTDLEEIAGWMSDDLGASFIGLNPLHSIPNRQPFNISPYLPASVFYTNMIYLDVERVEDFANSRRARAAASSREFRAEIEALRAAEFVEYERVAAAKIRILKLAFGAFLREFRQDTPRARAFREFIEREGPPLERFATWQALDEWIHKRSPDVWVWLDWPVEYRDPDSEATRRFAKKHWRLVRFYQYVQWQLDLQMEAAQEQATRSGMSIGLYHDLALATDRCGADLWMYRPFYVSGCRVGAPPDGFSPKGQDWAFPPPNSDRHREDGYRLFAESVRKNMSHGGALRIDHVMRFFRLYWIPEGMDPSRGAYVRDRYEELLPILALESVRQNVAVVGEDLGTVTREIRKALDHFGLFGYKVPFFEKKGRDFKLPAEYAEQALVASSTHDLPTLAGFWLGRDIEARRSAGLLDGDAGYRQAWSERMQEKQKMLDVLFGLGFLPDWFPRRADQIHDFTGELHYAFTGWIATARSRLMVLNQEDLLKDVDQQNLPATDASQYPNWRHKMRFTVAELRASQVPRDCASMFRHWLEQTGRLNAMPAADRSG